MTEDFLVTHNTLNDAFIILDEAQNTSMEQMKMFLTRLGFGSRIVVTGDITQVDLPGGTRSGLRVVQGILDDVRRHRLLPPDQPRRGPAQAGRPDRGRVRQVRGHRAPARHDVPSSALRAPRSRVAVLVRVGRRKRVDGPRHPEPVTVEINNESGLEVDTPGCSGWPTSRWRSCGSIRRPSSPSCCVDEDTMSAYHQKYMDEPGPTDVLSFPMDELRPPVDDEEPPEGLLGDIVLCPAVTPRQAAEHGRTPEAEAEYLLVHGLLHLLGYDHGTAQEQAEMFGLKDDLLAAWATERAQRSARGTRVR